MSQYLGYYLNTALCGKWSATNETSSKTGQLRAQRAQTSQRSFCTFGSWCFIVDRIQSGRTIFDIVKVTFCWDNTETMLRQYWDNAETMLRQCWDNPETILRQCWDNAKTMLRKYRDKAEAMSETISETILRKYRHNAETMLRKYRDKAETISETILRKYHENIVGQINKNPM